MCLFCSWNRKKDELFITSLSMSTTKEKIESIKKATGFKINSYKVINVGGENLVIEVNNTWIFRFPRNQVLRDKTKEQLNFLASFSKISLLKVPNPRYIEQDFIGYKKIPGKPLYKTNLKKLTENERTKIAEQIGLFLKTLHNYKNKHIDFDTGYLIMRKEDYNTCPKEIAKYLNSCERKSLEAKLKLIKENHLNFEKPTTIIHGDLYFNNILWNSKRKNNRRNRLVKCWARSACYGFYYACRFQFWNK